MNLPKIIVMNGERFDSNSLQYKHKREKLFASSDFGQTWHDVTAWQYRATQKPIDYAKYNRTRREKERDWPGPFAFDHDGD